MTAVLSYFSFGLFVAVFSFLAIYALNIVFSSDIEISQSLKFKRRNLIYGTCLISVMIGTSVSAHGVPVIDLVVTVLGAMLMSAVVYTDFGEISVPYWLSLVVVVPILFLGFFNNSPFMIVDSLVVSLPFGISALLLRAKKVFYSESMFCAFLGVFFGMGLGFVCVTLGAAIAAVIARKHLFEIRRLHLSGWMACTALVMTFVVSVFLG